MNKSLIHGRWIHADMIFDGALGFEKIFSIKKEVKKVTLYVTSIGNYRFYINNRDISKYVLTPFYTSYDKRVQLQTYDLTKNISKENDLVVEVAPGWALGNLYWRKYNYRDKVALLCWIKIIYLDGEVEYIGSDESFDVVTTTTTYSDNYNGETQDNTLEKSFIKKAIFANDIHTNVIKQEGEYVIEKEKLAAKKLIITPKGEKVIDFGQNMGGYVIIKIKGNKGDVISFTHGEILDKDGNFYNENYRNAKSIVTYVLSGKEEILKPRFSFQGFRYIKLLSYPKNEVDINEFSAQAIYSNMRRTSSFKCGNKKVNQLYSNIIWGQRSNFIDVPTDCPQRDERLGWLGDAQVFCKTASINYDVYKFFYKWLGDIRNSQCKDGSLFGYYPVDIRPDFKERKSAGWCDAITIIPYQMYLSYGKKEILKKNYKAMEKYIRYIYKVSNDKYLWTGGNHYGDWLALDGNEDSYVGLTPTDYIASVFFLHSTSLVIKIGKILNKDVTKYENLYSKIRAAIRKRYVKDHKLYLVSNDNKEVLETQTGYVFAINFDVLDDREKIEASRRLNEMIEENESRMTTGFLGTPYILHALSQKGYQKTCYDLLLQEKNPSWLYSVNKGATTIWEHYNGIKEDGSFWSKNMNSFNHYAYGSVLDWVFEEAAGIKMREGTTSYKELIITPHPDRRLKYLSFNYKTKYGVIKSFWKYLNKNEIIFKYELPKGTNAKLILINGEIHQLADGKHEFIVKI